MMLYGGVAVAAFLLLNKSKNTTPILKTNTGTSITPTSPVSNTVTPTGTYSDPNANVLISKESGLTNAQYAAMLAQNPNIANPNYRLTDAEATQYLNNYLDLRQELPNWVKSGHIGSGTLLDAAREHWKEFGAVVKMTFLPMNPPSARAYEPPPPQPATAATKTSGGGFWSTIGKGLGVATSIVGLFGDEKLNDKELEILTTGSAILNDILPMFGNDKQSVVIKERMDGLLKQYL